MESDAKIQPYLILAKNAKSRSLADLILKATEEPNLFGFGELLELPGVQELRAGEHAPFLALLELFCYGTWSDHKANAAALPPLSARQQHKLKQLTVATLATEHKVIPYDVLRAQLDIEGLRELEDFLITDGFYAGVLKGKLDQQQRCLQVHSCISRDIKPEQVPALTAKLDTWLVGAQGVLQSLERQVVAATSAAEAAAARKSRAEARQEELRKNIKAEMELRNQEGLMEEGGVMDPMDEDRAAPGVARPKRRR